MPERAQPPEFDTRSSREVKVLAVDDNASFRETLRDLVAACSEFAVAGVACSGEEAVRAVDALDPEIVLMDVVMPGIAQKNASPAACACSTGTTIRPKGRSEIGTSFRFASAPASGRRTTVRPDGQSMNRQA